jgi:restriction system protein
MSVPDFQSLMRPCIEALADGQPHSNREIAETIAKNLQLTEADVDQKLPSGQDKAFNNRVAWAKVHLKKAGLIENPSRGHFRITEQGHAVLAKPPAKIDIPYLKQFASYDWHVQEQSAVSEETEKELESTPEELIEASYQKLQESLADDVLDSVKACSPHFFERLVVDVLVAMGYGGSLADAGQAIGKTGDGGIDGIIKEDKLGLDVVCIQAKRWENTVGRPVVQAFAGSMEAFRARKGVVITTSAFSKDAEEFVEHIGSKIVLIDGKKLAGLMINHDVGVTTSRAYTIKKIDNDYFAEDGL